METSNSRGLIRRFCAIAFGMMVILSATTACASTANEQSISEDYKICIRGVDTLAVRRYDIIDVEKVVVGWRNQKAFAEFVFSEMGIGAYSKMHKDTTSNGVILSSGSDVVVYGQMFQPDGLFFISKSLQKGRSSVWIYAKFFGPINADSQASAMRMMGALKSCAK